MKKSLFTNLIVAGSILTFSFGCSTDDHELLPNIAPVVIAAGPGCIKLPSNSGDLTGSAFDADGYIVKYKWTKLSGPASYTLVDASAATTTVKDLVEGLYVFQFDAIDNDSLSASDKIVVNVSADCDSGAGDWDY